MKLKINCKPCMQDKHDKCLNPNTCLCAVETNHNATTFKTNFDKPLSKEYFDEVKEVNAEIDRGPKMYENEDFDLVANLIQSDYSFVTIRENENIWCYDKIEKFYKPKGETIIKENCQKYIRKCKKNYVNEVIEQIRRNETYIDSADLLESKHINTQDGILNPITFEVESHSPEYLTTSKLPFTINYTHAHNTKLWRHILSIIDPKDINLIMELIWICISWNNPFKKCFVFKGEPNTQKTTLADILVWVIGKNNVSREIPNKFLGKNEFSTSQFINKRMNIASEIGGLTENMLERLKSLVGAEDQGTEIKYQQGRSIFDSKRFVFLFTTNKLGEIYSSINDNSVITRFQFLIFRNKIGDSKANGQWDDTFFTDKEDKQSAINTLVRFVIAYKKAKVKTKWSNIAQTKQILKEEQPIEDRYFEDGRLIEKLGFKVSLSDIRKDFESFTGHRVSNQELGYILKKHGINTTRRSNVRYVSGYTINVNQTRLT